MEHEIVLPEQGAARVVGVSQRRLRAWADLVPPSLVRQMSPRHTVRLYGFEDVLALKVIAELSHRKVSTRVIRRAVAALRAGYDRPLTQLTWAEHGRQVYFQHPDGTWTGGPDPLQLVFRITIELEPLRQAIREAVRRHPQASGRSERARGRLGSKEVFAGTRIPVDAIARQLEEGIPEPDLLAFYPALTSEDLVLARRARTH